MTPGFERVVLRIWISELLLDLHRRATTERRWEFARLSLLHRRDMLRAMRSKRGYEG